MTNAKARVGYTEVQRVRSWSMLDDVHGKAVALGLGAAVVLGGVPTAAVLLSSHHTRNLRPLVSAPNAKTTVAAVTVTAAPASPAPAPDPLAGARFYVDPDSQAMHAANAARSSDPNRSSLLMRIASQPQAFWFGDWVSTSDIAGQVDRVVTKASAASRVPVLVAYDIPVRDCHGYSGGGATSPTAYRAWIDGFTRGIGARRAVVVLEPDALAQLDCLSSTNQTTRLSLLHYAAQRLRSYSHAVVYLDAGHTGWVPPGTMAKRLRAAGVSSARGFSLDVSNFDRTADEVSYGRAIAAALGVRTPFVIDTSRNGLGPTADHAWCNPPGRALGSAPTARTGQTDVDAFLWVKRPGESDGTCNGGPPAGQFWTDYAVGLAQRSSA